MAEAAIHETHQSVIPEQVAPKPKQSPWLRSYRWTKEAADLARAKGHETRRRNIAKAKEQANSCRDKLAILEAAIRNTKLRMDRAVKPEHYQLYSRVLCDLVAKLPAEDKPSKPEPSQSGPIKPLV